MICVAFRFKGRVGRHPRREYWREQRTTTLLLHTSRHPVPDACSRENRPRPVAPRPGARAPRSGPLHYTSAIAPATWKRDHTGYRRMGHCARIRWWDTLPRWRRVPRYGRCRHPALKDYFVSQSGNACAYAELLICGNTWLLPVTLVLEHPQAYRSRLMRAASMHRHGIRIERPTHPRQRWGCLCIVASAV